MLLLPMYKSVPRKLSFWYLGIKEVAFETSSVIVMVDHMMFDHMMSRCLHICHMFNLCVTKKQSTPIRVSFFNIGRSVVFKDWKPQIHKYGDIRVSACSAQHARQYELDRFGIPIPSKFVMPYRVELYCVRDACLESSCMQRRYTLQQSGG